MKLRGNELALLEGLRHWDDESTQGWKDMREIIDSSTSWKSQVNNFPECMKGLVKKGIVETKEKEYQDNRNKPRTKKVWRIKQTKKAYFEYIDGISIHMGDELTRRAFRKGYKVKDYEKYGDPLTGLRKRKVGFLEVLEEKNQRLAYDLLIEKKFSMKEIEKKMVRDLTIDSIITYNLLVGDLKRQKEFVNYQLGKYSQKERKAIIDEAQKKFKERFGG